MATTKDNPTVDSLAEIAALPTKSERLDRLSQTGLVRHWAKGDARDGLCISHGEPSPANEEHQWQPPFPSELLETTLNNGTLAAEAHEVLLSQNRILLIDPLDEALEFLEGLGDAVKYIRKLDICFDASGLHDNIVTTMLFIGDIAELIATKFDLASLELSLDTGWSFEAYEQWNMSEAKIAEKVRGTYEDLIAQLVKSFDGKRPSAFFVYWAVANDTEIEAERKLMGDDYDSLALGKIPASKRTPYFPHGAPEEELEWSKGLKSRYLE